MNKLFKLSSGFTLIELLVVIGILGVMSATLIALVDPIDKVNSANDTGAINTISQLGRANDAYAASHSNLYVVATAFTGAVTALNAAGESKYSTVTPPTNYAFIYLAPTTCTALMPTNCSSYVFYTNVRSKKYTGATPALGYYVWANGKGCTQAAAPTTPTFNCP